MKLQVQSKVEIAVLVVALSVFGSALHAATKATVTAPKGFADGIKKIALVTAQCAPQLDCPDVLRRVTATMKSELKLDFVIVADTHVREALFKLGASSFSKEHRAALGESLGLDALLEIDIPFAERGDGYGGRQGSETKVELRLVRPGGELLMSGSGFTRVKNVVSSPERVADLTVKEILKKAFP